MKSLVRPKGPAQISSTADSLVVSPRGMPDTRPITNLGKRPLFPVRVAYEGLRGHLQLRPVEVTHLQEGVQLALHPNPRDKCNLFVIAVRCKDTSVTLPATKPPDDPLPDFQGRARVVFDSGRRQFVHAWTAPRSPAARVVVVPLLLLAALLILAIGLLALLALVAAAFVVALFVLLFGRPLAAIRARSGSPTRRPPGA
jgi:hypothetical protein